MMSRQLKWYPKSYESVKNYVDEHIFGNKTAVLMGVLNSLYGLRINDSRYRHKLKQRSMKDFPERFLFILAGKKSPESVFDHSLSLSESNFKDKNGSIMKAAEYLREEILESCNGLISELILCDNSDQEDINEEYEESTLLEEEFYVSEIDSDYDDNEFLF